MTFFCAMVGNATVPTAPIVKSQMICKAEPIKSIGRRPILSVMEIEIKQHKVLIHELMIEKLKGLIEFKDWTKSVP